MKTMNKEEAKPPFILAIIDLIDTYHYADFFDEERYAWLGWQKYANYTNYEMVISLADRLFWALNPAAKTQEDWTEWQAGYDIRIYDANNQCVYKAHEKLPNSGAQVDNLVNKSIKRVVRALALWLTGNL